MGVVGALFEWPEGAVGSSAHDNRRFINGVMWILRTGSPWRDLPSEYEDWSTAYRRFTRWRDNGMWERLLSVSIDEPDLEWLFIDATHCKAHRDASGARGGTAGAHRADKRGRNTKVHLAVDASSMSHRILVTEATRADCGLAPQLTEAIPAQNLIADKGYDSNAPIEHTRAQGMQMHIPPRSNHLQKRDYDKHLYKLRHLVENAFAKIKQWRGIAPATPNALPLSTPLLISTASPSGLISYDHNA